MFPNIITNEICIKILIRGKTVEKEIPWRENKERTKMIKKELPKIDGIQNKCVQVNNCSNIGNFSVKLTIND